MKTFIVVLVLFSGVLLFNSGNFLINTTDAQAAIAWNLSLILAPVIALFFQWKIAKERQVPTAIFLTMLAVINTALVLGARAGAWSAGDWQHILNGEELATSPGKTILGGLVLAILLFAVLRRWWRLPYNVADALVIGLPLAGVVARVGCLFAGCCFGTLADGTGGVCYGLGSPAFLHQMKAGLIAQDATSTLAVYPIQLYLVFGNLLIFILLWNLRKKLTKPGALVFLGFFLLTAQRFGIEFFREVATNRGETGMMLGGLKIAQWLCLILAIGSLIGFAFAQIAQTKNSVRTPSASLLQQAAVLGSIAVGVLMCHKVLTLDELMIILVSCLPAMIVLGWKLKQDYQSGQRVMAPALLLSATAIGLFINPIDTIREGRIAPPYRQWLEVGTSGGFGNYKDISRDCDGNITRSDIVKYRSGGLDINSNWQRDDLYLKAGLRGVFGGASSDNRFLYDHNYHYSTYGLYGKLSYHWIGLSLGVFNQQTVFEDNKKDIQILPAVTLRIGPASRYSVDFRIYDEPTLGFSKEPVFSMGMVNWGFDDPSGNTFLRGGLAVTSNGQAGFQVSGRFPLGNEGLIGDVSAYMGGVNMLNVGLRYRFGDIRR